MKKLLIVTLTGTLLLGSCGQKEDASPKEEATKKSDDKNTEKKEKTKDTNQISSGKTDSETEKQSTEEAVTNEQQSTEKIKTNEESTVNKKLDYNNVTDRNSLIEIIYGNYNEEHKIIAYNSAVANGVIPQGNVMEGPASAAYESSLRVESGKEKSIYADIPDYNDEETFDYENNGIYRTPSQQEAHEDWVNNQDEWNNASESEKEKFRKRDAEKYGYKYDPNDFED